MNQAKHHLEPGVEGRFVLPIGGHLLEDFRCKGLEPSPGPHVLQFVEELFGSFHVVGLLLRGENCCLYFFLEYFYVNIHIYFSKKIFIINLSKYGFRMQ